MTISKKESERTANQQHDAPATTHQQLLFVCRALLLVAGWSSSKRGRCRPPYSGTITTLSSSIIVNKNCLLRLPGRPPAAGRGGEEEEQEGSIIMISVSKQLSVVVVCAIMIADTFDTVVKYIRSRVQCSSVVHDMIN